MKAFFSDKVRKRLGYKFPRMGKLAFSIFRRNVKGSLRSELFPGIEIDLNMDDDIQASIYWQGSRYESPTPQIIRDLVSKKGTQYFFDIGANIGFFSFYMKSMFPSLNVYCFEPGVQNYNRLEKARTENQLSNFYPRNVGLGNKEEVLKLNFTTDNSGHSTFGKNPHYASREQLITAESVRVMRFDDFLKSEGVTPAKNSAVAKIDVEGFELKVLQGMEQGLRQGIFHALVIEISAHTLEFCGTTPKEVYDFLQGFGYKAYDEAGREAFPVPFEYRNITFVAV